MRDEHEIMNIYECHIFELQDKGLDVKKTIALINATFAVAKREPEKNTGLFIAAMIFFTSNRDIL